MVWLNSTRINWINTNIKRKTLWQRQKHLVVSLSCLQSFWVGFLRGCCRKDVEVIYIKDSGQISVLFFIFLFAGNRGLQSHWPLKFSYTVLLWNLMEWKNLYIMRQNKNRKSYHAKNRYFHELWWELTTPISKKDILPSSSVNMAVFILLLESSKLHTIPLTPLFS